MLAVLTRFIYNATYKTYTDRRWAILQISLSPLILYTLCSRRRIYWRHWKEFDSSFWTAAGVRSTVLSFLTFAIKSSFCCGFAPAILGFSSCSASIIYFFKSVMFLSEHERQMMFEKCEISPECDELRGKFPSRFLHNCVFSTPSKSLPRLSALSIWLPHCKQTEFFEFGVRDSLRNDLVGVEPAVSIRRLTAVCLFYARSSRHVWYHLK